MPKMIETAYGIPVSALKQVARQLKLNESHIHSLYGVEITPTHKVSGILPYDLHFAVGMIIQFGIDALERGDVDFRAELERVGTLSNKG